MNKLTILIIAFVLTASSVMAVGTDTWPSQTGPTTASLLIGFAILGAAALLSESCPWWMKCIFILSFFVVFVESQVLNIQAVQSLETTGAEEIAINKVQSAMYLFSIGTLILMLIIYVIQVLVNVFRWFHKVIEEKKTIKEMVYQDEGFGRV